jgi:hypothetical protein
MYPSKSRHLATEERTAYSERILKKNILFCHGYCPTLVKYNSLDKALVNDQPQIEFGNEISAADKDSSSILGLYVFVLRATEMTGI